MINKIYYNNQIRQFGLGSTVVKNLAIDVGVGAGIGALTVSKSKIRQELIHKHPDWTADRIENETRRLTSKERKSRAATGATIMGATSAAFQGGQLYKMKH